MLLLATMILSLLGGLAPLFAGDLPPEAMRRVRFEALSHESPRVREALATLLDEGALPRLAGLLAPRQDPGARARALADGFVRRRYPGVPAKHRRSFRRAGEPAPVWFVLYDVDVQPTQDLLVRVDLATGGTSEVLPL